MSTNRAEASTGPGRPRLVEQRRTGGNPREEILDAAGELFSRQGYAGTSTRAIAEAVGLRQASLYHHFATKDDILAALLETTVAPTLAWAQTLDSTLPPLEQLVALAEFDITALATSRWNLGALYLLPELRGERFTSFRTARLRLADIYAQLAAEAIGTTDDGRARLPFRLVESVISMRSDGQLPDPTPESDADGASAVRIAVTAAITDAIRRMLSTD
ncbi:TetR/AcrR family transcriptional regulator [Williamsia sp. CHRR-6]|uniref:TetR/AcrR family transcriptional regulator n=1 Tax=Williamsia sp. CHRR-6 TaxID=2835871 RepID=UPI001BD94B4F|nr:TetR/AcrR family transcriptional regulator [Williamsia sp. CHRR-6]MBT0566126.1 TetR/AcrR family transcriptional regulator [Williamsia sp. CHRR-6]